MASSTFFNDETGRLRTAFRLGIFGTGFLALYTVVSTVILIAVLAYWIGVEHRPFEQTLQNLTGAEWELLTALSLPLALVTYGWVWICRRYIDKRDMASIGVRRPKEGWVVSMGLGLLAGMLPIVLSVAVLFATGEYTAIAMGTVTVQNLVLVPALVLAAFVEEITCRGYLLQNFVDIRRPWLGLVLSNLIFWLMHAANPHVWSSPVIALNLFFAGVLLSLAYLVSGNLWFPTAVHFGWNFCQGVVFGIPISGIEMQGWLNVTEREGQP